MTKTRPGQRTVETAEGSSGGILLGKRMYSWPDFNEQGGVGELAVLLACQAFQQDKREISIKTRKSVPSLQCCKEFDTPESKVHQH